jgi:hypothetical protein
MLTDIDTRQYICRYVDSILASSHLLSKQESEKSLSLEQKNLNTRNV